jgi:hypothetical protein
MINNGKWLNSGKEDELLYYSSSFTPQFILRNQGLEVVKNVSRKDAEKSKEIQS